MWPICRLDTAEYAELQARKHQKKETAQGWDIFNQKTLYNAYMKRTQQVMCSTPRQAGL